MRPTKARVRDGGTHPNFKVVSQVSPIPTAPVVHLFVGGCLGLRRNNPKVCPGAPSLPPRSRHPLPPLSENPDMVKRGGRDLVKQERPSARARYSTWRPLLRGTEEDTRRKDRTSLCNDARDGCDGCDGNVLSVVELEVSWGRAHFAVTSITPITGPL
jgi:hypothetical protein